MRLELLYNPSLLCERLGIASQRRRRLARLKNTVAGKLKLGEIDSLELLELLRGNPPKVIYDIGANVGTWTLLAKAIHPGTEVHAFEPLTKHVVGFKSNTKNVGGVHLHPIALGASKGNLPMQVASLSDASTLLEIGPQVRKAGEEIVAVERVDDYVLNRDLPLPDLIKLDVQGYELEVLRGGLNCLRHARAVITEVSFIEFYQKQCLLEEVIGFMAGQRYRLHSFSVCTGLGKALEQTDVLFLRAEQ